MHSHESLTKYSKIEFMKFNLETILCTAILKRESNWMFKWENMGTSGVLTYLM